jgi:plasmid maintenance system antidote protein VapI
MPPSKLPPGLDPVTAGRFGLWLLGKRQHSRSQRRSLVASTFLVKAVCGRAIHLIAPWPVWQYPGKWRALSQLLGVSDRTARAYISGERRLPEARAARLAAYLRRDLEERREVVRLLEQVSDEAQRVKRAESLRKAKAVLRERRLRRLRDARRSEPP